jgi:hypothetical protein
MSSTITLYLTYIFTVIALLASLTLYLQPTNSLYLKLFPFFLFIITILSFIIGYLFLKSKNNAILFNLYSTLEFCFYFFVFGQIIFNKKIKKIIYFILLAYPILEVYTIFSIHKIDVFTHLTYSLGCLLIVFFCIWYFFELFQLTHAVNLLKDPDFWICCGLFFYYACNFPIFSLLNFLKTPSNIIIKNISSISNLLDVCLYSSFTIAFLCRIKIRKSM